MKQATLLGVCAGYAAYCLFVAVAGIRTSPDSVFYISFSPIVPTGYPVFLRTFGEAGAVVVQPLVFAGAVAWLAFETLRQWSSLLLALAVIVGCIAAPGLPHLHASVLTESLFMSCEVMLMAAMMRFVREPHWKRAALAGVIAGVAATIRNAGYAFLPVLIVMALLEWRRLSGSRAVTVAAIVAPVLVLIAAERATARLVNGDEATSLLGRHLFAKAALIEAPRPAASQDPNRALIENYLDVDFARIRETIAAAPARIQSLLLVYYETCLQGPCARAMREASIARLSEAEQNDVLVRVAVDRLASAPLNFIRLTVRHYLSLWMAYKQEHPSTTPVLNEFLSTRHPLPYETLAFSWREPGRVLQFEPDPRVRFLQPAVMAIGWLTGSLALVALVAAVMRRGLRSPLEMAALAALTAHAGIVFSATFAPGISRFTLSFWPAVMTAMVFGGWWLLRGTSATGGTEA